jgi:hypothetical protein
MGIGIAVTAAARKPDGGSVGKPTANTSKAPKEKPTTGTVNAITANAKGSPPKGAWRIKVHFADFLGRRSHHSHRFGHPRRPKAFPMGLVRGNGSFAFFVDDAGRVALVQGQPRSKPMTDRQNYIRTLLDIYAHTPGVAVSARGSDQILAGCLFDRHIPIDVVESALLLGSARRMVSSLNGAVLSPVRSLHYFAPIVEEVLRQPLPPNYVHYLRLKICSAVSMARCR